MYAFLIRTPTFLTSVFKIFSFCLIPNLSLKNLFEIWKHHGVYTYQVFYIGFAESLVGLDFYKLHFITHIFKELKSYYKKNKIPFTDEIKSNLINGIEKNPQTCLLALNNLFT